MTVRYHQRRGNPDPRLPLRRREIQRHAPRCQHIPGATVDEAISQLLLDTVTPLALEVALTVQTELEARADEADQLRRGHVERARHHAELARHRYLAVDPDNRLVADTLEADWNDALRALQTAQDDYQHASDAAAAALTPPSTRPASASSPPTSPPCGLIPRPRNASASASRDC